MRQLVSRLLCWWYETDACYQRARLVELEADAKRIEQDIADTRYRLIKAEMRQLQHAEPV